MPNNRFWNTVALLTIPIPVLMCLGMTVYFFVARKYKGRAMIQRFELT